jgi:glycosyltransferase involved in cell wall biosynthesis
MKDEERNLPRALASIPRASRVLAIDAESTDRSVEVARARAARVIVRPWAGFVEARRFGLGCVETPWTFMLDADEQLDMPLSAALAALAPDQGIDGYATRRSTFFCGHAMRYGAWGADAPLRFFRTGRAALVAEPVGGGSADIHERWTVAGGTGRLDGTLLHYSYPTLADYRTKFARYTALEARGLRGSPPALAREVALAVLRVPHALFVRGGWRDGWRGVFVAFASAAYPVAVAWKALRT